MRIKHFDSHQNQLFIPLCCVKVHLKSFLMIRLKFTLQEEDGKTKEYKTVYV